MNIGKYNTSYLDDFILDSEDYPQDEPVAETKASDGAAAEPEPEAEAEPDSKDHEHKGHSHDHSDKKGHVHGSQGRKNLQEGSSKAGAKSTQFEAVAWMIMTLTSVGILLQQNNFLTL